METRCQKCGTPAQPDQAFCSKCGAVIGMSDAGQGRDDPSVNMAATIVGAKFPFPPPSPRPASAPPQPAQNRPETLPPPSPVQSSSVVAPPPARSNTLLFVVIGFLAVLLVGGLLILLLILSTE